MQVRQAAGDGVGEPTAADPVAGLNAQVATQGALEGEGGGRGRQRNQEIMKILVKNKRGSLGNMSSCSVQTH